MSDVVRGPGGVGDLWRIGIFSWESRKRRAWLPVLEPVRAGCACVPAAVRMTGAGLARLRFAPLARPGETTTPETAETTSGSHPTVTLVPCETR